MAYIGTISIQWNIPCYVHVGIPCQISDINIDKSDMKILISATQDHADITADMEAILVTMDSLKKGPVKQNFNILFGSSVNSPVTCDWIKIAAILQTTYMFIYIYRYPNWFCWRKVFCVFSITTKIVMIHEWKCKENIDTKTKTYPGPG